MKHLFKLTNSKGEAFYIHASSQSSALQSEAASMLAGDGPIFNAVCAEKCPPLGTSHLYIGILAPTEQPLKP